MYNEFDMAQYIAELKTPWLTMGPDMDMALSIITKHKRPGDGEPSSVELLSVSHDADETLIRFPDWQSEVEREFVRQYGLDNGRLIFKKVVMRLYQLSKGSAQNLH